MLQDQCNKLSGKYLTADAPPGPCPVNRQTQIPESISRLSVTIDRVHELANIVRDKLSPVLSTSTPGAGVCCGDKACQQKCELSSGLDAISEHAVNIIYVLEDIQSRLEL